MVRTYLDFPPSVLVSSFSDTFNRASGRLGTSWAIGNFFQTPFNTPVSMGDPTIGADPLNAQALIWSFSGGANPNTILNTFAAPIAVYPALQGKTHFAQVTYDGQANITNNAAWEVSVCGRMDVDTAYTCNVNMHVANAMSCYKVTASSYVGIAGITGFALPAVGDVIRLSVDFSVANQVTIRISKNGTLLGSAVDASPFTVGGPMLRSQMASGTYYMQNFSCGPGL